VAILAVTGTLEVLGQLPADTTAPCAVVSSTAADHGDGTWSVTVHAAEDQIAAMQEVGCTVEIVVSDADELARWQVIDSQVDTGTGVA
jgi:uncharacterized Rossmann fold enzyme